MSNVSILDCSKIFGRPLPREEGLHGNYRFYRTLCERTHFAMASHYGFTGVTTDATFLTVVKTTDMHYITYFIG